MEAELRYRAETVRASFLPTYGLCVAGLVYVALTYDEPNRHVIDGNAPLIPLNADTATRRGIHRQQGNSEAQRSGPAFQHIGRWCRHPPLPAP